MKQTSAYKLVPVGMGKTPGGQERDRSCHNCILPGKFFSLASIKRSRDQQSLHCHFLDNMDSTDAPSMTSCNACKRTGIALKQCPGCKKVAYCSKECQRSRWKEHKSACNFTSKNKTTTALERLWKLQQAITTSPDDFIWFVEIRTVEASGKPIADSMVQGPFILKYVALFTMSLHLEARSPGPEDKQRFDALLYAGALSAVNAVPERFEAPLAGSQSGTISYQLIRQVNKAVKGNPDMHNFTVARADFSIDAESGKQVITSVGLKPEKAFNSKTEAESFLDTHARTLREPDMTLNITTVEGSLVSMCYNQRSIVVLMVVETFVGGVVKFNDLSLSGPIFQKLFFRLIGRPWS